MTLSGRPRPPSPQAYFNASAGAWRKIRARHASAAISRSAELRYRAAGAWLSFLSRAVPSSPVQDAAAPVFVVGHWRSGTTLLHELICAEGAFGFPTTYACMNPQLFSLDPSGQPARAPQTVSRPMDDMTISASSPQEDEFALMLLGAVSPYEHLLFPEAVREIEQLSNVARLEDAERSEWERIFRGFLDRVSTLNPGKRIVLKSPPHGFRIALLSQMFPQAQFVRILRRPDHVLSSTVRLWRSLWKLYALTEQPDDDELLMQCAKTMQALHKAMDAQIDAVEPARRMTLTYDGLLAQPTESMMGVLRLLEPNHPPVPGEALRSRIAEMPDYRPRSGGLTEAQTRLVRDVIEPLAADYKRARPDFGL